MSKFERIVREPLVMGGQARIRDTGITVNEIVRLSLDGASQAEILQQFPQLEAEDVHEALGFAMDDTIHAIAINRSAAFEPLTTIVNYGQLALGKTPLQILKDGVSQDKTDETSKAFKQILSEYAFYLGNWTVAELKVLSNWVRANFMPFSEDFTEPLHDVISKGIEEAKKLKSELIIESSIEADTELIIDDNAGYILAYVLAGAYEVIPKAQVIISQSNEYLLFTVRRTLERHVKQYNCDFTIPVMEIAMIMLYRLGSELKIRQEESSVIFEFALPIVESES